MSIFRSRHSAVRAADGVAGVGRTNQAEELVSIPWALQMSLEGRTFMAGHGLEEAATDGEASLDETTPTFVLGAPAGGTVVVPLWAEIRMHAEGGAAPDFYCSYVGVDRSTITKTDLDVVPVGRLAANAQTSKAIAAKTGSAVTAITSAQTVMIARRANILDNLISVEAVTLQENQETVSRSPLAFEFEFWNKFGGAFALYQGQAIMFHTSTGTSDSTYSISFAWIELPSGIYVP